jgi:hypothetical protein
MITAEELQTAIVEVLHKPLLASDAAKEVMALREVQELLLLQRENYEVLISREYVQGQTKEREELRKYPEQTVRVKLKRNRSRKWFVTSKEEK